MVKTEISSIWYGGAMVDVYGEGPLGYSEGVFMYDEEPLESVVTHAAADLRERPLPSSTLGKNVRRVVSVVGGGMVLLVLIGSGFIVRKAR